MTNKKIAFVYDLKHPLHIKFFKNIDCDFISLNKKISKNYEVYVVEGSYIKPLLMQKLGKFGKNKKIITLFSDPRLFYLNIGKKFDFKREEIVKYPLWRSVIAKSLIKKLRGAICTSEITNNLFKKFNSKSPSIVIPGFVFDEKFKSLKKINPDLNNQNILFIGHGPDFYCKGLDLLIKSFKKLKKKFPKSNLYILGKWAVRKNWVSEGIHFEGERDIVPYLEKCSLSIHLGRGESFGINIVETMLAGIPTIVSKYTGAKDVVEKTNEKLVISLREKEVIKSISNYFSMSQEEKNKISLKCKKIAGEYNEKKITREFKNKFDQLLGKI